MVWYFIGVYIINRTLHGRLEIRNFSSRLEKIFRSFAECYNIVIFTPCVESYLHVLIDSLYIQFSFVPSGHLIEIKMSVQYHVVAAVAASASFFLNRLRYTACPVVIPPIDSLLR